MIKLQNPDSIYVMSIAELWNIVQAMEEDEKKEYHKELLEIKEGYKIKIPILYLTKKWYDEYPENKRVSIKGHGKINILDLYDEIESRYVG